MDVVAPRVRCLQLLRATALGQHAVEVAVVVVDGGEPLPLPVTIGVINNRRHRGHVDRLVDVAVLVRDILEVSVHLVGRLHVQIHLPPRPFLIIKTDAAYFLGRLDHPFPNNILFLRINYILANVVSL